MASLAQLGSGARGFRVAAWGLMLGLFSCPKQAVRIMIQISLLGDPQSCLFCYSDCTKNSGPSTGFLKIGGS